MLYISYRIYLSYALKYLFAFSYSIYLCENYFSFIWSKLNLNIFLLLVEEADIPDLFEWLGERFSIIESDFSLSRFSLADIISCLSFSTFLWAPSTSSIRVSWVSCILLSFSASFWLKTSSISFSILSSFLICSSHSSSRTANGFLFRILCIF